jgi:pyridoxamine 5'-phosphate oxidase
VTGPLLEDQVDPDPLVQFQRWFSEAVAAGVPEPEAMTLATSTPLGDVSARMVLLRGVDERGFRFFTNRDSRKGRDLAANPRAALVFHWHALGRQVRISGRVHETSTEESAAYFATRPRGSQLSAWASEQSEPIGSRAELERRVVEVAARFEGVEVPPPPRWGGYVVEPEEIEFWQRRLDRLHDRLRYARRGDAWVLERLMP